VLFNNSDDWFGEAAGVGRADSLFRTFLGGNLWFNPTTKRTELRAEELFLE